jgi:hypothetical protein
MMTEWDCKLCELIVRNDHSLCAPGRGMSFSHVRICAIPCLAQRPAPCPLPSPPLPPSSTLLTPRLQTRWPISTQSRSSSHSTTTLSSIRIARALQVSTCAVCSCTIDGDLYSRHLLRMLPCCCLRGECSASRRCSPGKGRRSKVPQRSGRSSRCVADRSGPPGGFARADLDMRLVSPMVAPDMDRTCRSRRCCIRSRRSTRSHPHQRWRAFWSA